MMDDWVVAVAAVVAEYRRREQRIKNIAQIAFVPGLFDEQNAIIQV